jgi:membrane-bound lytic murein transglycosylase F
VHWRPPTLSLRRSGAARLGALALVAALASACGPEAREKASDDAAAVAASERAAAARADLPEIRARGTLRLLVTRGTREAHLPRTGSALEREREIAVALARELGVEIEWVQVESIDDLLPALLEGRGDLVVGNLTTTSERRARVIFSAPVAFVREQIVTRASDTALDGPADLAGRRVAVRESASHWKSVETLRHDHPQIALEAVPDALSAEEILAGVADGRYDVAIADGNRVRTVLEQRSDLRVAFELDAVGVIAWAMRPEAVQLRQAVDGFLVRRGPAAPAKERLVADLPGIRERGVLRVLTQNNAANYYVWNGELMGFEYELAREFAKRLDLRLDIIVPPTHGDMFEWLREGRGDLVAASLTATPERAAREDVAFSRRTNRVSETIVARADDDSLREISDLAGRRVAVRPGSHYRETLEGLRAAGIALEIELTSAALETEEIIERVASGAYDLTLADSHVVDIELTWRDDVRAALRVGEPVDLGWVVRHDNPELLRAVNDFFRAEYRGTLYNVLASRYFREPKRIRAHAEDRPKRAGRISPFDESLRKYARIYGFDWRLIAAQMHQESRFDPDARSFAGALGLMQVMPRTAREVGIENLNDPDAGIHAGVRYLAGLRDRLGDDVPDDQRTWFALASYNVGFGHVRDARSLARERGWDPDLWFGNVERAMLLKRRRDVAAASRFGWCRGDEPVRYVRAIRDRYRAYVEVVPDDSPSQFPGG